MEKMNKAQNEFMFVLLKYREEGNCKKVVTAANNVDQTITCNRKPRGFCNIDQSLITQGDVNFLFSEAKKVRDRNPDCETSFVQSGILLTTATTASDESNIRTKHVYTTLNSCEEDGFTLPSNVLLASFAQLQFLETARGRIGKAAKILSINLLTTTSIRDKAKSCLDKEFTETERNLLTDITAGKVITDISK